LKLRFVKNVRLKLVPAVEAAKVLIFAAFSDSETIPLVFAIFPKLIDVWKPR